MLEHQAQAIVATDSLAARLPTTSPVPEHLQKLGALVGLKALLPHFWDQRTRDKSFVLTLPDMHKSKIFVDDNWDIIHLIDLEFAPICPVETTVVPIWLTDKGIEEIEGPHLEDFKRYYHGFVDVLEEVEGLAKKNNSYSQQLRQDWKSGKYWYLKASSSMNAFPFVFEQHLQPRFFEDGFKVEDDPSLYRLRDEDADDASAKKLEDLERYNSDIREIYANARYRAQDK